MSVKYYLIRHLGQTSIVQMLNIDTQEKKTTYFFISFYAFVIISFVGLNDEIQNIH